MPWVILLVFILVLSFLLWLFPIIEVFGDSMYPTLHDREYIIGQRKIRKEPSTFKINEIYIYKPPVGDSRLVIKRLTRVTKYGLVFMGDNKDHSYDSRHYGYVSPYQVIAKVKYRKKVKV
jgi:nickel-type superoxide dismutase maturation protease